METAPRYLRRRKCSAKFRTLYIKRTDYNYVMYGVYDPITFVRYQIKNGAHSSDSSNLYENQLFKVGGGGVLHLALATAETEIDWNTH